GILGPGQPAAEQRDPHRLKVASADDADPRKLLILDARLGTSFYLEAIRRTAAAHRQIVGEAGPRHLGIVLETAKEIRTERADSIVARVRSLGECGLHGEDTID